MLFLNFYNKQQLHLVHKRITEEEFTENLRFEFLRLYDLGYQFDCEDLNCALPSIGKAEFKSKTYRGGGNCSFYTDYKISIGDRIFNLRYIYYSEGIEALLFKEELFNKGEYDNVGAL